MSGLSRYVSILRLFTARKADWTVQEIGTALEIPKPTIYRTMRELAAEGFVEPSIEGHYRLGSAFVEFDRLIRVTDPLVRAGGPLLRDLIRQAPLPSVAVLARLYKDRVICAVDERTEGVAIPTSYERGRPMPLLRGATSKTILAHLPSRRLRGLLKMQETPLPTTGDEQALRNELASIRRNGFCITRGEVDSNLVGLAVPIANPDLALSASLSLIVLANSLTPALEQRLVLLLVTSANLITEKLASGTPQLDAPSPADRVAE